MITPEDARTRLTKGEEKQVQEYEEIIDRNLHVDNRYTFGGSDVPRRVFDTLRDKYRAVGWDVQDYPGDQRDPGRVLIITMPQRPTREPSGSCPGPGRGG